MHAGNVEVIVYGVLHGVGHDYVMDNTIILATIMKIYSSSL